MKQAPLVVVIYDGIHNSVFDSQVVYPLMQMIEKNPKKKIILVSFEKQNPTIKTIQAKIPNHPSFTFIVCKKMPYIGLLSLHFAARALQKVLKKYSHYDLIARGPLAGFICKTASNSGACNSLIIQARGLLSEEYAYENANETSSIKQLWYAFRQWQFFKLEKNTYAKPIKQKQPLIIQAVSKALGEYLITIYNAERAIISIAMHDIPPTIAPTQLALWKKEIRNELAINFDAKVYCYNGSIKPWQCPEQIISYFKQKYEENAHALLLVLTQDKKSFEKLIQKHGLPAHTYRVLSVLHKDIYRYLAAADIGMMFREPHIVNWVSRPTKALEYKAAGLAIEHNNTVSWLIEQNKSTTDFQLFAAQQATSLHTMIDFEVA